MTSQHREGQILMEAVMDDQPAQGEEVLMEAVMDDQPAQGGEVLMEAVMDDQPAQGGEGPDGNSDERRASRAYREGGGPDGSRK